MKKIILLFTLITCFSSLTKAQQATEKIDIKNSIVKWSGSYSFDFGGHEGTVKIKSGELIKTNDKIIAGTFVMDMSTIVNTDGDYSSDLVDHLKSEDFFDVENYPSANFSITKVKYHDPNNTKFSDSIFIRIHGDLTIKDTTLPLWFEAELNPEKTKIEGKLKIDRTLWGVNFKSKSVSAKLKDRIISDAIEFRVVLQLR